MFVYKVTVTLTFDMMTSNLKGVVGRGHVQVCGH